ncbi:FUSC family protein [Actinomycetospora endophytica]|uniref:FUSC family protein n=1 Tax=Actinomycetospora endophytica TaxID=2291215 RepID=A0ABS8P9M2_9PSEU|nr:FUSC family protein [Actinomycetospora endophytica]MCD2194713.1 FUSC family protein [Actinomycetospora endophytica]
MRRVLRWLLRHDPGLTATRKAVRIAVAASIGFLVCRYALDQPTVAVYAVFGVIGFGVFSEVSGTPAQRTRTILACWLLGSVLVTVGSLLAVTTWAATLGVLVAGVAVALLALGGPRAAGVVNGLHLLYILPSFPPFTPGEIPLRIAGLTIGIALLALADRFLLPPAVPRSFARRAADAARAIGALLEALPVGGDTLARARRDSARAAERLRLGEVPVDERPTGPGAADRGLTHLAAALRAVYGRVEALEDLAPAAVTGRSGPDPEAPTAMLAATAQSLREVAAALDGRRPLPGLDDLDAARAAFTARRVHAVAIFGPGEQTVRRAETSVAVAQVAEEQRLVVLAARVVVAPRHGVPASAVPGEDPAEGPFWYAGAPPALLWWRRLRCHLTLRSVYLQNAVRLGVGLAIARLVAGELDVAHGFWVLLATLTLMRTSAASTRAAMLPAIIGTTIGGTLAIGLVLLVGPYPVATAALLPVIVVVAVASGRFAGVIASQACFTVVVAVLFAQLSPPTWRLGPERVVDVVLGAVIGLVVGAAVWPAGGHGEVRRAAGRCLDVAADLVDSTTKWLAGTTSRQVVRGRLSAMSTEITRYEATYTQFRSERRPARAHDLDWMAVLGVVHRVCRGARSALTDPPAPDDAVPWPDLAARLRGDVEVVADRYHRWAVVLRREDDPHAVPGPPAGLVHAGLEAVADLPDRAEHPVRALRLVDAWGWLGWLADDLEALERIASPPVAGPSANVLVPPG